MFDEINPQGRLQDKVAIITGAGCVGRGGEMVVPRQYFLLKQGQKFLL